MVLLACWRFLQGGDKFASWTFLFAQDAQIVY